VSIKVGEFETTAGILCFFLFKSPINEVNEVPSSRGASQCHISPSTVLYSTSTLLFVEVRSMETNLAIFLQMEYFILFYFILFSKPICNTFLPKKIKIYHQLSINP
jgi:hypothetical protein